MNSEFFCSSYPRLPIISLLRLLMINFDIFFVILQKKKTFFRDKLYRVSSACFHFLLDFINFSSDRMGSSKKDEFLSFLSIRVILTQAKSFPNTFRNAVTIRVDSRLVSGSMQYACEMGGSAELYSLPGWIWFGEHYWLPRRGLLWAGGPSQGCYALCSGGGRVHQNEIRGSPCYYVSKGKISFKLRFFQRRATQPIGK